MPFFIIFIIVPLLELAIFAAVSEHIGVGSALLFALLTAIIGGALVKHQGLQTILKMRKTMDNGQIPLNEIFDGFCLVAAGALLITPGFLTDTIGFLLLLPPVRQILRNTIKNHTNWAVSAENFHTQNVQDPNIIEGEYEKVDNDDKS